MNNDFYDPDYLDDDKDKTTLKEIFFKYLTYWKWFLFSFILAMVVAFFYLKRQIPQYNIQSSILIKDDKKGMGQDDLMKQLDMFASSKVVDNEIEILRSYMLMDKVVTSLNLNVHYLVDDYFRDSELYTNTPITLQVIRPNTLIYEEPLDITILDSKQVKLNGITIPFDKATETPYGFLIIRSTGKCKVITALTIRVQPTHSLAEALIANLKIEPSSKMSSVLMMSIIDPVTQRGCDILNKLVELYDLAGVEDKNRVAANTLAFIEERLKLISQELGDVEKNVENYKVGAGITDISAESNLFLTSVQQNDVALNQVKIQQQVLNGIEQYVHAKGANTGTVPATLGIEDPVLLSLINQLVELEGKKMTMSKVVKPNNPIMLSIDDQILTLRKSIGENIATLQKSFAISRQQLEARNKKIEGMLKTIPGKERQLVDISRQQAIKNSLYIFLLQKREETALSYSSAVSDSRTIDKGRGSDSPVSPNRNLIYIIFSVIGLALPFSAISIIDLLNDKIVRHKDITDNTEATILGEVSFISHDEPLVVTKMGRSLFAEQVRALRTNLAYLTPGKKLQSILFTSSFSGEGKSFVSLNLGASLAMMNKKVVILEFDLRKPKLKSALKIESTTGLSNYLIGKAELNEIIFLVEEQPNLSIITSGAIPPNPVELMVNGRLAALFTELRERFDYIIIDAPPIGIVTDAQVLEEHADATLYVLRHDYTPKSYLKFIDALYNGKKLKTMNLIFNGIKQSGRYGYGYGYEYGYGYTDDHIEVKKKIFQFKKEKV